MVFHRALVLLIAALSAGAWAQESGTFGVDEEKASALQPFYGSGDVAPNETTTLYVSVGVEKITNVDDGNFLFEGVFR